MTSPIRIFILLSVAAILGLPAVSSAQSGWELNGHGAVFVNDVFAESGTSFQAGARLFRHTASGIAIGGNFDFARVGSTTFGDGIDAIDLDTSLLLYSFELDYVFPRRSRTQALVGAGIGGVSTRFSEEPERFEESTTGTLVPIAFGLLFHSDPVRPRWSFRIDVRDNLIAVDTRTSTGDGTSQEMRNNWEISAGFSVRFGGPSTESSGAAVDTEPVPSDVDEAEAEEPAAGGLTEDTDRDGVIDADDRCVNTPRDAVVDERGCPVEEERPAPLDEEARAGEETPDDEAPREDPAAEDTGACLGDQPWFTNEAEIDVLDRRWRPVGEPEPITLATLIEVGRYEGVRVYVAEIAQEPYDLLWIPVCQLDTYQAYELAE